jgi:hypothetical protein
MAPSDGLPMTARAAAYLVHHVVLPPKLPQQNDYDASHEHCLIDVVICALQDLRDDMEGQDLKDLVTSAITAIMNLDDSRDKNGDVSELQLQTSLRKLAHSTTDSILPLEIKAQNAGILASRCGDRVVFESFELSPSNKAAMGSTGRLIRSFPGSASDIPVSVMKEKDFRESYAYTIAKMSTQTAREFQAQIRKNRQQVEEDRDTNDPAMVSEWFMNNLASLGRFTKPARISKNTREEVLWNDCRSPWRRSPLWLLIRVTLQLLFTRRGSIARPLDGLYKAFVAQVLSRILQSTKEHWKVLGSEILYVTYAKLARRIRKLEHLDQIGLLHAKWAADLKASMVDAHSLINEHWTSLASSIHMNADTYSLRNLQPAKDLDTVFLELDVFVTGISTRHQDLALADFRPTGEYPTFSQNELPRNLHASGLPTYLQLAALEQWIEQHLELWLSVHLREKETCGGIYALMKLYHSMARTEYVGKPTSLSIMYLSLLDLWVASDRSACHIHPMLCQFDPELGLDEFQCLVLPFKSQMQRLLNFERYVQVRRATAAKANPSIFQQFGHASTFAVKYFDQCPELQATLEEIKRDATSKQKQKREELADLKRQHKDLMDHYNSEECQTVKVLVNKHHSYYEDRHSRSCTRCASKTTADNLTINIYEWPVSSNESTAKATVFELCIPQAFSDWRDASMFMISSILGYTRKQPTKPQFQYTLAQHHGLTHLLSSQYHSRRIVPLSSVKSHTSTHRKTKKVPDLTDSDVCPPNALQYMYYDTSLGTFTGAWASTESVGKNCMYQMPDMRSKGLEQFLYRPPSNPDGKTPNEVIAGLSDCPTHLSIDEYKSLVLLPSGRNIIYSNILVQLATPSVDFAKAETHTLLLQVIEQCGVSNRTPNRVSHRVLLDKSFCCAMLEQLEISLLRVSENWESWRAVATFIALGRRILSLTSSASIRDRSLKFLHQARQVSMKWLKRLKTRATESTEDQQRSELYSRATEVALLCSQTSDVESAFIDIVFRQPSAVSILLQCSIVIQENCKAAQSESQPIYRTMLQSWKSLLYRAFTALRQNILQGDPGLHTAVLENWADFQPTPAVYWNILSEPHEHWLFIKSGSLTVYFNLLTAELLVNGLPLARLPLKFMEHPMYRPLFGKCTLELVPTDRPGMSFSAKSSYRDYKLHFGMRGADMLVVAISKTST